MSLTELPNQKVTSLNFLSGGGEMGERIRNFDWSKTSVGAPMAWPQSLRSAISICLNSNFPIAIYWGKELTLIYNDAWSPIPGNKHPWALGKPARQVWPDIWQDIEPQFEKAFTGEPGGSKDALLPMQRHGYTEECYFDFTFTPVYGETGKVEGVFNAVIETTYQVLNERRSKFLKDLTLDLSSVSSIQEVLQKLISFFKYHQKSIPFAFFYNAEKKPEELIASTVQNTNQIVTKPWPFHKVPDGEKIYFLDHLAGYLSVIPKGFWPEDAVEAVIIPCRDNTNAIKYYVVAGVNPRRRFDADFRIFFENLSDIINNTLRSITSIESERKKADVLAALDKAKTVFFSNISHEFRTPLTLMLGTIEEALLEPNIIPKNHERLTITHRNAMRLLKLVNTLLDFSRLESGRQIASYSLTDITTLTKNLAANFRSVIEKGGLEFIIKAEGIIQPVYVDRQMWEKIVFNLLSNAFKYTLTGSIELKLYPEKKHLVLEVADTGVGIPESELPHIFQRFHRVLHSGGRTYEGTGIGLSFIKELVQLHGGSIGVKSKIGEGTTFTVKIPFGKDHLPANQTIETISAYEDIISDVFIEEASSLIEKIPGSRSTVDEKKTDKILVVDDNADMRDYLGSILQKKFSVIRAVNGLDALHKLKGEKPLLVISDIMMPVMDGIQLLKTIKEEPNFEHIPVILLTARAGEESTIEGYKTGADDYLVKPFSAKELIARIEAQIRIRQKREAAFQNVYSLFDDVPFALAALKGESLIIDFINKYNLEVWQQTREAVIGKPLFEVRPDIKQSASLIHEEIYRTGKRFTANELPVSLTVDGQTQLRYFNTVIVPMFGDKGKIIGQLATSIDVTEQVIARKKIEENQKKLQYFIQKAPVCIAIYKGKDFIVQAANESTLEIWGKKLEEVLNRPIRDIFPEITSDENLKAKHDFLVNKFLKGEDCVVNEDKISFLRNGKIYTGWFNYSHKTVFDENGKPEGVIVIANEVTDLVLARIKAEESELQTINLNKRLAEELSSTRLLQEFSSLIFDKGHNFFDTILATAMQLMKSDFASLQVYEEGTKQLTLLANKNFHPGSAAYWEKVDAAPGSVYGEAFRSQKRVIVSDVETAGLTISELKIFRLSGIRSVQSTPLISRDGKLIGMLSTQWKTVHSPSDNEFKFFDVFARQAADLIENKRTTEKIANDEKNFRDFVAKSPMSIMIVSGTEFIIELVNEKFLHFSAMKEEQLIGKKVPEIFPLMISNGLDEVMKKVMQTGDPYHKIEYEVDMTPYGIKTKKYFDFVYQPLKDEKGNFNRVMVMTHEVTELIKARKRIEESEKINRLFIEHAPAAMAMFDKDMRYISVSKRWLNEYDLADNIIGKKHYDLFPNILPRWKEVHARCMAGAVERSEEDFYIKDDGTPVWLKWEVYPWYNSENKIGGIVIFTENITARKKDVQALKESEERLRMAFESAKIGAWEYDPFTQKLICSDESRHICGIPEDLDPDFNLMMKYIDPKDQDQFIESIKKALSHKGDGTFEIMLRFTHYHDEQLRWVKVNGKVFFNEEHIAQKLIGTMMDVTEEKKQQIALKESEERYRTMFHFSPHPTWEEDFTEARRRLKELKRKGINDLDKYFNENREELLSIISTIKVKDVNKEAIHAYGGSREELLADLKSVFIEDTLPTMIEEFKMILAGGGRFEKEALVRNKKGDILSVICRIDFPATDDYSSVQVIWTDITERKKAELLLHKSEERFRAMANEAPIFVWETDEDLQTTFLNKEGCHYFGLDEKYKVSELSWKKFIHPDDIGNVLATMKEAAMTCSSYTLEMRLKNGSTGEYHWFLDKGSPRFQNDKFIGFIGTSLDINERKEIQKELEEKVSERTGELSHANLQLIKQNQFVETVINSSQEWIAVWDKDLRLTLINDAALVGIGKSKDEVIGKTLFEILPNAKGTHTETDLRKALAGEYVQNEPFYSLVGKWVRNYIIPMKDNEGNVYAAFAVAYDVTAIIESQIALQKSQQHFASLFNVSPVAKIITRADDGKIIDVNPAWERLFRKTRTDVIGKTMVDIGIESNPVRSQKLKGITDNDGITNDEEFELKIEGNTFYMLTSLVSIDLEGVKCYLGAFIDITERKKQEEQRIKITHELAIKNEELETTIQLLRTHELLDEQKNSFIAMASHELKTPITSIKGYVQLLLNALEKEKENEKPLPPLLVRSSLISVDKQIKRLTRLISELLDISRIETGSLELKKESFSLNELAIETVEDILYTNAKHKINLFHDYSADVFADKDRIGQVMINLLTNAIKYSPQSNKIDVTIFKYSTTEVAFSVKDSGIGIDKKEQGKIFERFYRAEGKAEQTYPGFGIGLFIAKEFIEKHGGKIWVNSKKGTGSTFTFTLPVLKKNEKRDNHIDP